MVRTFRSSGRNQRVLGIGIDQLWSCIHLFSDIRQLDRLCLQLVLGYESHIPTHTTFLKCFFQAISWPKSWPRGSVHAGCSASEADLVERTRQDLLTASIQTWVASAMPMWGFKIPKKSEHAEKHEPRYADVLDLWSSRGIETAKKLDLFQPKWGMSQPEMRVGQSVPIVDWLGNLGG